MSMKKQADIKHLVRSQVEAARPFVFVYSKDWPKFKSEAVSALTDRYQIIDSPIRTSDMIIFAKLK